MSSTDSHIQPHRSLLAAVLTLATSLSTGCATAAHGRWQDVGITSDPPGADLFISDRYVGTTPLTLSIKRSAKHFTLRFTKAGFIDETVALRRENSAWIVGDVALALNPLAAQGLNSISEWPLMIAQVLAITLGIDFLSGGAYKLPESVRATLSPSR